MEPFISNDTYACPDCGSEVKVGARSCPGCGPFRPVEWEDADYSIHQPTSPFHSATTYTDTREVLESSYRPKVNILPVAEKPSQFIRVFLFILIGLTILSATMAALKIISGR